MIYQIFICLKIGDKKLMEEVYSNLQIRNAISGETI